MYTYQRMENSVFCVVFLLTLLTSCHGNSVTFTMLEKVPTDTEIGNIAKAGNFSDDFQFSFLDQNNEKIVPLFGINENTGSLYTIAIVDRDGLCVSMAECILTFDVAVKRAKPSYLGVISVSIIITDRNDHTPMFDKKEVTVSVSEGQAPGKEFPIKLAKDGDSSPAFNIHSYEILPQNATFGLRVKKNALTGSFIQVNLVLKESLDRESKSSYELFVVAKDGGSPPKAGILTVNIQVLDSNDHPPVFTNSTYNLNLGENTPVGKTILKLTTTDKDIGSNAEVTYQFSQENIPTIQHLFDLNSKTGQLILKNALSYDAGEGYRIVIDAIDKGDTPMMSQAIVKVHVLDTTNNPPDVSIKMLSPGSGNIVNVPENSEIGNYLEAYVRVSDSDTGENGKVSCYTTDETFALKTFPGQGYTLIVFSPLDRETKDSYDVNVICEDYGEPPLKSNASVLIRVTDENDNPPQFEQKLYSVSIMENNKYGVFVAQVLATDLDIQQNGEITYKMARDSESRMFSVSSSGIVTANESFDREEQSHWTAKVLAVDNGDIKLTGTATIEIDILDENDNAPHISKHFEFNVGENMPSNTIIKGFIYATDKDFGKNSDIKYFINGPYDITFPFVLFENGTLKTNRELDREEQSRYDFSVIAKDYPQDPSHSRNSTSLVTVYVDDVNDNYPTIVFPKTTNKTFKVLYPTEGEVHVTTIVAFDIDANYNAHLIYRISAGDSRGLFKVGSQTGEISVQSNHLITADEQFALNITVSDEGSPPLSRDVEILVKFQSNNITAIKPLVKEEPDNFNIFIVIIVSVVTVGAAIAIVAVIFVLRKTDRRQKNNQRDRFIDDKSSNLESGTGEKDDAHIYTSNNTQNAKKEVSFNLTESRIYQHSEGRTQGLDIVQDIGEERRAYNPIQTYLIDQLALSGHHNSLSSRQHAQQAPDHRIRHQADDIQSETSGETIDSGKGGSIEDIRHNELTGFHSTTHMQLTGQICIEAHGEQSRPISFVASSTPKKITHVGRPQQLEQQDLSNNRQSQNSRQNKNMKKTLRFQEPLTDCFLDSHNIISSNLNTSSDNYSSFKPNTSRDNYSSFNQNTARPRSADFTQQNYPHCLYNFPPPDGSIRDDDDDGTTTSGEYTVNHEDVDEYFNSQYDCVV